MDNKLGLALVLTGLLAVAIAIQAANVFAFAEGYEFDDGPVTQKTCHPIQVQACMDECEVRGGKYVDGSCAAPVNNNDDLYCECKWGRWLPTPEDIYCGNDPYCGVG